jgi:PAS domain S-box-containing protein
VSVPLLYAAFSIAWVGLSDLLLATLPLSPGAQTTISMLKGFAFIAATTILLAVLLRRGLARERSARLRIEANEAMLRAITDTIPDPVFLKDRSSTFLFANPATLAAVGKPAAEVLGRRDTEVYADPAVGAALLETDRRIMDSGVGEVVEENIQTATGYRVYLSTKAPFRDAEGQVAGIVGNARDVTAARAADRLLREGEERLRLALDAARMGVWDWSLATNEVVCSARTRALFGLPSDGEVSHGALLATLDPDDRPRVEELARAALASGSDFAAETRVTAPDGTARWVATTGRGYRDADGRPVRLVGMALDVTDRKRADEALASRRALEDQLAKVAESVPGAILSFRLRPDGSACMPFTTPAVDDLYGIDRAALANDVAPWAANVHPDDLARVLAGITEAARTMSRWHDEFRYRHPVKGLRWIEGWSVPQAEADGGVLWHGYVTDVTERNQAREALHRNEVRFRALIEKSTDVIVLLDRAGLVTFFSPSAAEALGWAAGAVLGRAGLDLVHPEDRPRVAELFPGMLKQAGATLRFTARFRRGDGAWRVADVLCRNLLHDPAVEAVVVNMRDVTEQRRLEDQVQQAQRLDSIGRLAGGVAHDFNNLLTVILSCAEVLKDDLVAGGAPSVEDVEEIQAAGARARDLTRQLLAFARRQVIAPVALDLNAVVAGSEKMLRRLLGEDIALEVVLQPGLWAVRCDAGQMEQILLNLAVNARDAMPRGGTLAIETSNVTREDHAEAQAETRCDPGRWVRLTVRDSGVGMAPDVKSHVFEPFFTTKPSGEGTGLGLATVYGIVRQSEGHIHVDSAPGRGTTFEVCLPRTPEAPAALASQPAAKAATGGSETVLVVEDDPQVRGVTVRALEAGGYRVLVASDGREALATGAAALRGVRLLVTDVVMPGMDGRALADALREAHPGIRVLFVSGYTQDRIAERGVLASGIEFLPKPFTAASLLSRVRAVLDA